MLDGLATAPATRLLRPGPLSPAGVASPGLCFALPVVVVARRTAGGARVTLGLERPSLAHTIGAHPSHLRVAFKRRYGITIHEYQTLLRLRTGLRMLGESDAKVEAVARAVGYRSAKDFYRGVRDLTGLTPRAARGLDPASMAGLFSRLLRIQ